MVVLAACPTRSSEALARPKTHQLCRAIVLAVACRRPEEFDEPQEGRTPLPEVVEIDFLCGSREFVDGAGTLVGCAFPSL